MDETAGHDMRRVLSQLETASPKDGWLILGPGGGGCVHLLTINPNRPSTILVACDMTAGYITHNGGESWREFNLKSRLYSFAFDPLDPDVIYAGSSGLFRSQDNGSTWQLLFPNPKSLTGEMRIGDEANHTFLSSDNWPGGTVQSILIDPENSDHLWIVVKTENLRLFSSIDAGETWMEQAEIDGSAIHCLIIDYHSQNQARDLFAFTDQAVLRIQSSGCVVFETIPENIIRIRYASAGYDPGTTSQVFYLSAWLQLTEGLLQSTVWKSLDRSASWQRLENGLEGQVQGKSPVFSQVSTCRNDPRTVYLLAEQFPELGSSGFIVDRYGILKSSDEGECWKWVVKMDDNCDPNNRTGGWAERDYGAVWGDLQAEEQISPKGRFAWDVVASPVNPNICYTMDFSTIFETRDGGASWNQVVTRLYADGSVSSRGIDILSAYGVFFDPFDGDHLAFTMTDVGVFQSHNQGRTWVHSLMGVPREWINTCYWMVFDPDVKGRVWSAWAAMHDIPRKKMFQEALLHKYKGGICESEDGMRTWTPSNQGMPVLCLPTHLLLDPTSPSGNRRLYAAVFNGGVYKSEDGGKTWVLKNNGIDPENLFAWRMALLPDGTLYLIVIKNQISDPESSGALYRSVNCAESWEKLALPEDVTFPTDIGYDPSDPKRLYLSAWPQTNQGDYSGGGLYTSDDAGSHWKTIFNPNAHVYAVSVDPAAKATLYIGTFDGGVYRSDNFGESWKRLKGINFQWCQRPIPDPYHENMLYVTTFGSSVWYGPVSGVEQAIEDISNGL